MRCKLSGFLVAVIAVLVLAAPAFAHHGYAVEFDSTKCFNLQGKLSGVVWENPHAYFRFDAIEDGKTVTWSVETISPNSLKRSGTTRQDVLDHMDKPAVARVCPTKAGGAPHRGTAEFFKFSDGLLRVVGQNIENTPPEKLILTLPGKEASK